LAQKEPLKPDCPAARLRPLDRRAGLASEGGGALHAPKFIRGFVPFWYKVPRNAGWSAGLADKRQDRPSWIRYTGVGIEFAGAVAGFTLVGHWIDRKYQCSPWGVLIGASLGLIGGTYNPIRESLSAFRDLEAQRRDKKDDGSVGPQA